MISFPTPALRSKQANTANDMRNCALTHNLRTNFFPVIKGDSKLVLLSIFNLTHPQQNYRNVYQGCRKQGGFSPSSL